MLGPRHAHAWGSLIGASVLLAAMGAFATPACAGNLVINPSKIQLQAQSGTDATFTVEVSNTATLPVSVQVSAWDFARDEQGAVHPVGAEDAARFHGCSEWVTSPSNEPTVVKPNTTSKFEFGVEVPADVNNESRYCYLEFRSSADTSTQPPDQDSYGIKAPIVYAMNAMLLVQVGRPTATGIPAYRQGISVKPLLVKRINFDPQVKISAPLSNKGTVHANLAEGSGFQIWRGDTLKATIPLQEYTLLPESTIDVPAVWSSDVPFGLYKVRFVGSIGEGEPITAASTFWVVRPWLLAAVLAGLVLVFTLSVLFLRRFRIQLAPRSKAAGPEEAASAAVDVSEPKSDNA